MEQAANLRVVRGRWKHRLGVGIGGKARPRGIARGDAFQEDYPTAESDYRRVQILGKIFPPERRSHAAAGGRLAA
jgi:hypothetical protein